VSEWQEEGVLKRAGWLDILLGRRPRTPQPSFPKEPLRIGLALGGGFARGIAHAGVLKVFEQHQIPVDVIAGVSAGAIVAAAYASGASPDEIARAGCSMRFTDVARWSLNRMGFVGSDRMEKFLKRLLKVFRFEDMRIPLAVVATDLVTGEPVLFRDTGDVNLPIRASCSYPGLFQPVKMGGLTLVDGAMSVEVPALVARKLGATRVVSVHLPMQGVATLPQNMFQVINRSFQIMQKHMEDGWRRMSDVVIVPEADTVQWDEFASAQMLIEAGEKAAEKALPEILKWMEAEKPAAAGAKGKLPAVAPVPIPATPQNGPGGIIREIAP
jgi:NTE family protein